jgi:hypothetical protein
VKEHGQHIIEYVNAFRALPEFEHLTVTRSAYEKYITNMRESPDGSHPPLLLEFLD